MYPQEWFNSATMCRLCLQQDGFMLGIFNHIQGKERSISKKISECTALQIAQGDGLPHIICHRCLYKLEFCLEFRQQCYVSDATLRRSTSHANCKDIQPPVLQPETMPEPSMVMVVDPNAMDYESEYESDANMPPAVVAAATLSNEHVSDNEMTNDADYKNVSMCTYCDKAFSDKAECARHEVDEHDPAMPFKCGGCAQRFADRVSYATHVKTQHLNDKPYSCPECDRCFARRSDLRKHTIVHTGIKPYTCPFCLKSFSRNTNLSKHIRIHTDQKTYSCHRCSQAFYSKVDLTRHNAQHAGVKPHVCHYCNLGFMRKDKLAKHLKRHTLPTTVKDKTQELQKLRENLMQEYGVPETYLGPATTPDDATKANGNESPPANCPSPEKLVVNIDPFSQDEPPHDESEEKKDPEAGVQPLVDNDTESTQVSANVENESNHNDVDGSLNDAELTENKPINDNPSDTNVEVCSKEQNPMSEDVQTNAEMEKS